MVGVGWECEKEEEVMEIDYIYLKMIIERYWQLGQRRSSTLPTRRSFWANEPSRSVFVHVGDEAEFSSDEGNFFIGSSEEDTRDVVSRRRKRTTIIMIPRIRPRTYVLEWYFIAEDNLKRP